MGQQLRRAAVSIPANIAEGYGRQITPADFHYFLRIALGSTNEVMVLVQLTVDLGYAQGTDLLDRYNQLGKQIYTLMQRLK